MARSLNVTPKTTLHSGKSEAYVTIIKHSAVIILLRLTTDGHKASRSISATAALLVTAHSNTVYLLTHAK